jgi:hypothetical protein
MIHLRLSLVEFIVQTKCYSYRLRFFFVFLFISLRACPNDMVKWGVCRVRFERVVRYAPERHWPTPKTGSIISLTSIVETEPNGKRRVKLSVVLFTVWYPGIWTRKKVVQTHIHCYRGNPILCDVWFWLVVVVVVLSRKNSFVGKYFLFSNKIIYNFVWNTNGCRFFKHFCREEWFLLLLLSFFWQYSIRK